jgi:hypothetical protein
MTSSKKTGQLIREAKELCRTSIILIAESQQTIAKAKSTLAQMQWRHPATGPAPMEPTVARILGTSRERSPRNGMANRLKRIGTLCPSRYNPRRDSRVTTWPTRRRPS